MVSWMVTTAGRFGGNGKYVYTEGEKNASSRSRETARVRRSRSRNDRCESADAATVGDSSTATSTRRTLGVERPSVTEADKLVAGRTVRHGAHQLPGETTVPATIRPARGVDADDHPELRGRHATRGDQRQEEVLRGHWRWPACRRLERVAGGSGEVANR